MKARQILAKNDYHARVQRIFFVDEAHRSYSSTGEFFKNLMTCDMDAVYIALTGMPLLSKKERSNLKFGDYVHKYFYDKSIADGYTLRIKKDFIHFRLQNSDASIGDMIVCRTNSQAKKVHEWFKANSKLNTGLVDELLQKIFHDLSISDLNDLDAITDELLEALERAGNINYENERLSKIYGGNYAFVKTYQDAIEIYPADKSEIERTLVIIYNAIEDALDKEMVMIQGRKNFAGSIKSKVTTTLLKEKLHGKIKVFYTQLLNDLYTNIQLFK